MTLYEVATAISLGVVFIVITLFAIESNRYITERNRLRKLTGKYYDFDIIVELERQQSEQQTAGFESEKVATNSKRTAKTKTATIKL